MKRTIVLLVATPVAGLLAVLAVLICFAGLSQAGAAPTGPSVPARGKPVIVEVTGDAANGFGIEYSDGTGRYPPTDSESLAECSEYDARVDRVRCRAQFRTWYRDLADLQRALAYAHHH